MFVCSAFILCNPKYKEMDNDASQGRISVGLSEMNELEIVRDG